MASQRSAWGIATALLAGLLLVGGAGAKTIRGTARADTIRGTAQADVIYGLAGNDRLFGLGGNDRLVGGPGNDRLFGGPGTDVISCGPGRDRVVADRADRVAGDCELVSRPSPPSPPPLPARDGRIAFQGFDPGTGSYEIFIVNPDGSGLTNVTAAADSDESEPSWSPDGRRVAFTSTRDGGISGAPAVYVMNADGTGVRKLVGGGLEQSSPAWSPDGRWIAFSRCTFFTESGVCSSAQIVVVQPDGQGARNVTEPVVQVSVTDSEPAWSPDGKRIVFSRTLSFGDNQIWVVNAAGKELRRLLADDSESDHHPSWSPDGARIVFSSDALGTEAIFLMNADGSGVQKLVDEFKDPDDPDATIGGGAVNPSFSPSGTRIVFSATGDLWSTNVAGQDVVRVTETGGDEPDWGRAP
jgi:Tol biopolymer transport system component